MEMQTANHILAKEGILTSFKIAKRITPKDVTKLREKLKGITVSESAFDKLLHRMIIKETESSFENHEIPGLLVKEILNEEAEKKRLMELTYLSSVLSKQIVDKKYDKYYSCYIINALINMLGLTESDFNEFHARFTKFKAGLSDTTDSSTDRDV